MDLIKVTILEVVEEVCATRKTRESERGGKRMNGGMRKLGEELKERSFLVWRSIRSEE